MSKDSKFCNYIYDPDTETLTISGSGAMEDYSIKHNNELCEIFTSAPWGTYYNTIKTVIINPGITRIGDCAFFYCTKITNVKIPESVTEIGWNAFSYCTNLESIYIPESVTEIEDEAFWGCDNLKSISIPKNIIEIKPNTFNETKINL